jgi:hypothetical protein
MQELKISTEGIPSGKPTHIAAALFKNNHQLLKRIKRMKTTNDSQEKLQQNIRGKLNNLAGIFILLAGLLLVTTFSAFAPSSSDLPTEYQVADKVEEAILYPTDIPSVAESIYSQNTTIPLALPDSVNKSKKEKDKDVDSHADVYVDLDSDTDTDTDKDIDKEAEKELEAKMEALQKELERAEQQMEQAMKAYEKAMVKYHDAISKSLDARKIEDWSVAEKEYAKAIALAKLHQENFEHRVPEIKEIIRAEIMEAQIKDIEEKLEEIELVEPAELMDEHMLQELQMMEIEIAEQLKDLQEIEKIEFEGQKLETQIREELVKDGFLNSFNDKLSFVLTKNRLEINGNIQSDKLQRKYFDIYTRISDSELNSTMKVIIKD